MPRDPATSPWPGALAKALLGFSPLLLGGWSYCGYWGGNWSLNICLPEVAGSCAGVWSDEMEFAAGAFNGVVASPRYLKVTTPASTFAPGNRVNEVAFTTQATFQETYGPISSSAIGVTSTTRSSSSCTEILETDIFMFVDFTWTLDRTAARAGGPYSYEEVALHELGHAMSLQHSDGFLTVMNSSTHTSPALWDYPHSDEVEGLVAHSSFSNVSRRNHAILPYADSSLTTVPPSMSRSSAVVGERIFVDGIRAENWGTLGAEPVEVSWVLSSDPMGEPSDIEMGTTSWSSIGSGFLSNAVGLDVPFVQEATYYVIGVVDPAGAVPDAYTFEDQVVMGTLFVECPDGDGDGYKQAACGGNDCDDTNREVYPGAPELCDNRDQDCDGLIDEGVDGRWYPDRDGDGYGPDGSQTQGCPTEPNQVSRGGDCDDQNPEVNPDAEERCDGIDNDCNDRVDEGVCDTGLEDDRFVSSICGCATTSPTSVAGFGLLLAALVGLRRRRHVGGALVAMAWWAALLTVGTPALASTVPLDHEDLVGLSESVVVGKVANVRVEPWGPFAVPVTLVDVEVNEVWKGAEASRVTLYQAGGPLEDGHVSGCGTVHYRLGDTMVLFLERSLSGVLVTAGMNLGAFTVQDGTLSPPDHPHATRSAAHRPAATPFAGWTVARARAYVTEHRTAPRPAHVPLLTPSAEPPPPGDPTPVAVPAPRR